MTGRTYSTAKIKECRLALFSLLIALSVFGCRPVLAQDGLPLPPAFEQPAPNPEWEALRTRITALEEQYRAGTIPTFAPNRALLRFKLDQAQLWLYYYDQGMLLNPTSALRYLTATVTRADLIAAALGDATREIAKTSYPQVQERAYFALDGTVQPFWIYLPADYSPLKKYPLVLFLHGYDPDLTKIYPWLPGPDIWQNATKRGLILVVTYGRRNSDFVNVGEDDTYAVRREAERSYSVDAQRVSLLGVSMGGTGALVEALHRPGAWAGVAALSARSDLYKWANLERADVADWKRPLYDADDPHTLASNMLGQQLLLAHGELDLVVALSYAHEFVADLKQAGVSFRYREVPDGPHTIYADAAVMDPIWDWLKTLPPAAPPRRVRYVTASLTQNRAYWATINGFDDYAKSASIDVQLQPGNQITATLTNVRQLTLSPPASLLTKGKPITLVVNGQPAVSFAPDTPIHWPQSPATTPATPAPNAATGVTQMATAQIAPALNVYPGTKSPTRCGPIKECYRSPFLVVYGKDSKEDEVSAWRFARERDAFADGLPPVKADVDVTEDDKQRFNIVLFGTRQSNALLRGVADTLPVELVSSESVRIGTQIRTFDVAEGELGMQLCYPSPWNDKKMLVVQSGYYWGSVLPINHKYDLLPDYIVYDSQIDTTDSTNQALVAGWFTHDWQLAPDSNTPLLVPPPTTQTQAAP